MERTTTAAKHEPNDFTDGLEALKPHELLTWAFQEFDNRIALASSFQAEESVLIDMAYRIGKSDFRVFTLDTGRLNQETYECMDAIQERYGVRVEVFFPDAGEVEAMVRQHGLNLFYKSTELRKMCCAVRKVNPLNRALKTLEAWMTGLRREQSVTRDSIQKIQVDHDHGGILKLNPLVDWSQEEVWNYIHKYSVPYNRLHDAGYPSIGCAPCTRAVAPGENLRAGRWWWESPEAKECGLHARSAAKR